MDEQARQAFDCWRLMANGMGGLDWSALPIAVARYGVRDVSGLIDRLLVIRGHKPEKD